MPSDIPVDIKDSPPFAEPWHGQLFAMTLKISENGHFSWPEWADLFSANLARASQAGAPKDASRYYDVWLETFEAMLLQRKLASVEDLQFLKQAWTKAYLETPHGEPVTLAR